MLVLMIHYPSYLVTAGRDTTMAFRSGNLSINFLSLPSLPMSSMTATYVRPATDTVDELRCQAVLKKIMGQRSRRPRAARSTTP